MKFENYLSQPLLFDLPAITKQKIKKRPQLVGNRKEIRDIWNAFMVKNCTKWENGIPFCPTKKIEIPKDLITYSEAVGIYNKEIKQNSNFKSDAYVCFYEDDYKFDGIRGIWFSSDKALKILKHFAGIITPYFSTYDDFPIPLKTWNTYRMRAFGFWCTENGINVINNVRWSEDTLETCLLGIPKNSIVCLGTVASGLQKLKNRAKYGKHLFEMVEMLKPKIILTFGSATYDFFSNLKLKGVIIKSYVSKNFRYCKFRHLLCRYKRRGNLWRNIMDYFNLLTQVS